MEDTMGKDQPIDDLAQRLQAAIDDGRIPRHSAEYKVAKFLIMDQWKDLSEKDREIFNKHVRPIVEEQ